MEYRAAEPIQINSEMERVVDLVFERLHASLPKHVPKTRSMMLSFIASTGIFATAAIPIFIDKQSNDESEDIVKKYRWIGFLLSLFAVCIILQDVIMDRIYLIESFTQNHQHFANVFWLRKYMSSLKLKPTRDV